jgi:peptidoglycan/LPS O-acetylase OafA/YrhL
MPKYKWLGDFDGRRDNNFTLLRLLFAWAVLFGHSWAITGAPGGDPISVNFRGITWIGAMAVDGFFVISGFLVTASIVNRGLTGYVVARVLRIWPGLTVCILLSVAGGLVLTTSPKEQFLSDPTTWNYLHNIFLWPRIWWYLPGVFESHVQKAINGSLWTLPVETLCYFCLLLLGILQTTTNRWATNFALIVVALLVVFHFHDLPVVGSHATWARPILFFIAGSLLWINRSWVPITLFLAIPALLLVSCLAIPAVPKSYAAVAFAVGFPYLIFYLACGIKHIPADRFPGDISYGIYIYAWPCQQLVFWHGQSPYINAALASVAAITLATMSWYLVESRALRLKVPLERTIQYFRRSKAEASPAE